MKDTNKVLNTLLSPKIPMPQKRSLMHVVFGDYRKRIAEEERRERQLAGKP